MTCYSDMKYPKNEYLSFTLLMLLLTFIEKHVTNMLCISKEQGTSYRFIIKCS